MINLTLWWSNELNGWPYYDKKKKKCFFIIFREKKMCNNLFTIKWNCKNCFKRVTVVWNRNRIVKKLLHTHTNIEAVLKSDVCPSDCLSVCQFIRPCVYLSLRHIVAYCVQMRRVHVRHIRLNNISIQNLRCWRSRSRNRGRNRDEGRCFFFLEL